MLTLRRYNDPALRARPSSEPAADAMSGMLKAFHMIIIVSIISISIMIVILVIIILIFIIIIILILVCIISICYAPPPRRSRGACSRRAW